MITSIEGTVTNQTNDYEAWTFDTTITEKVVTGWLADAVLSRVGVTSGVVTSWENSSSYGTCDLCGSYFEYLKLFVDGQEVYSGEVEASMEEGSPNPFAALQAWLDEGN